MGFKKNKVKADLCSYPPFIFLAPKKFGKTTFWYNLVPYVWGDDDKGLLISFSNEEGYHALDGLQYEVAKDWNADYDEETGLRGFVQIVDDIVENNDDYGIKGVCFDTLDTMIDVATKEVLRQHRKEKGTVCKSLLDAFSGYGRGKQRLLKICNEQIDRLRSAGIAVFILCHIKNKEKTDLKSGEKYEMITNNLTEDIFSNFGDAAQMVMTGAFDRQIENGKLISENRAIYLRGDLTVDAGGRFKNLPEKINLDVKEFMDAFENAVKSSMRDKADSKTIEKMKAEEQKEMKKKADIAKKKDKEFNEDRNEELLNKIKENMADLEDAEVKKKILEIIKSSGAKNLSDMINYPTHYLEDIYSIFA